MTKDERKDDYVKHIIPYRLATLDIMRFALTELIFEDGPKPIKLYIDGKLRITGQTNAFSNAAIEAGIITARALLEFLGLQVDQNDPKRLKERSGKQHNDDLFIEDFTNDTKRLSKVTIEDVHKYYPGPPQIAEGALARVIHIAHKEIAHSTLGRGKANDDIEMVKLAAKGIRALTVSFFLIKLGIPAPASPVNEVTGECPESVGRLTQ